MRLPPKPLLSLAAIAAAGACYAPTEVIVPLSTDLGCSEIRTAVFKGRPGSVEPTPDAEQLGCVASSGGDGNIGSLVFVPDGSHDARVTIKAVLARNGKSPSECQSDLTNCIVASRTFSFFSHLSRRVPIRLVESCLGKFCEDGKTCAETGQCVSDEVTCAGDTCELRPEAPSVPPPSPPLDAGAPPDRCRASDGGHVLTETSSMPGPQLATATPTHFFFVETPSTSSRPRLVKMIKQGGPHAVSVDFGDSPLAIAATGDRGILGLAGPTADGWNSGVIVEGASTAHELDKEVLSLTVAPAPSRQVYVLIAGELSVFDADAPDKPPIPVVAVGEASRIAVDGDAVYVASPTRVNILARGDGASLGIVPITASPAAPQVAFATDSGEVFVAGLDKSTDPAGVPTVARLSRTGATTLVRPGRVATSVAADAPHVYFTDGKAIYRVPRRAPGNIELVRTPTTSDASDDRIDHLVVDAECLFFWHRTDSGTPSKLEVWRKEPEPSR